MSSSALFFLITLYIFAIPRRDVSSLHRLLPLLLILKSSNALLIVYRHSQCPWTHHEAWYPDDLMPSLFLTAFQGIILGQLTSTRGSVRTRSTTLRVGLMSTFFLSMIQGQLRNFEIGRYISFFLWTGYCYLMV
jgi:hypothetical protein